MTKNHMEKKLANSTLKGMIIKTMVLDSVGRGCAPMFLVQKQPQT